LGDTAAFTAPRLRGGDDFAGIADFPACAVLRGEAAPFFCLVCLAMQPLLRVESVHVARAIPLTQRFIGQAHINKRALKRQADT
jgi:hypothetical protein